jgi:hypothetical protein
LHDFDIWPQGWPDTHVVATVTGIQPHLNAMLSTLHNDLSALSSASNAHLYHATNDLPLLWLKTRRQLAGFLLYYHLVFEQMLPEFKGMKFGAQFLKHPVISSWLDQCRDALQLYHSINGTEYWSPRMLDSLLIKIKFVQEMNDFQDATGAQQLLQESEVLIDELEKMTESGLKLRGAEMKVYNHRGLLRNDIIIGVTDQPRFFYQDFGLLDLYRHQTPRIIESRVMLIKGISETWLPLTGHVKYRRNFFTELRAALNKYASLR